MDAVRATPVRVLAAGGADKFVAVEGRDQALEADRAGDGRDDRAQADGRGHVAGKRGRRRHCERAEDFAFVLRRAPGAYILVGNGETAGLHNPKYDFNDAAIPYGVA